MPDSFNEGAGFGLHARDHATAGLLRQVYYRPGEAVTADQEGSEATDDAALRLLARFALAR